MTGIERLREFAKGCRLIRQNAYSNAIGDIADQIEQEARAPFSRVRVLAVISDMESRVSDEGGSFGALVARWARELRGAVCSGKRDPAEDVSVSAYDLLPADEREAIAWVREHGGLDYVRAEWRSRSNLKRTCEKLRAKVERQQRHIEFVQGKCRERQGHIVDLNNELAELRKVLSDYRDALGGMCERLGITDGTSLPEMPDVICEALDRRLMPEGCDWEFLKLHMSNLRGFMLDVMGRLGVDKSDSDAPEIVFDALDRRLMPEGVEWPRFEDGEPVRIGDVVNDVEVRSVVFRDGGILLSDCTSVPGWGTWRSYKEPIKRPPVLAADGKPLEVGQTVYVIANGKTHHVTETDTVSKRFRSMEQVDGSHWLDPMCFTHQRPVLDADGVPIKVGDTVWDVEFGCEHVVTKVSDGAVFVAFEDESADRCDPASLTHRAPVLAADGGPLREGETVYGVNGGCKYTIAGFNSTTDEDGDPCVMVVCKNESECRCDIPSNCLTHERPDSWERIEEDATLSPEVYCHRNGIDISQKDGTEIFLADTVEPMARDLVRRCRALAERERGE